MQRSVEKMTPGEKTSENGLARGLLTTKYRRSAPDKQLLRPGRFTREPTPTEEGTS